MKTAREATPVAVRFWDDDSAEWTTSQREYVVLTSVQGAVSSTGYASEWGMEIASVTLYLDAQTGLVVWDVEAYEKNL